jgi:hypothetical protein
MGMPNNFRHDRDIINLASRILGLYATELPEVHYIELRKLLKGKHVGVQLAASETPYKLPAKGFDSEDALKLAQRMLADDAKKSIELRLNSKRVYPGHEVVNIMTGERFIFQGLVEGEVVLESEGQRARVDEDNFRESFQAA